MVLRLYGMDFATCTKRVRVVLEELGVAYELVPVDILAGAQHADAHRAKQPFGQIPYIEDDDGLVLFESRAICRYLALRYGGAALGLVPEAGDIAATARFEQAASIETSNFDPYASGLAYENVFKVRLNGPPPDPAFVKFYETKLEAKLVGYDALLSKTKYIAGDTVTIIDLFHLSYGSLLETQGYDYLVSEKYPNVARWWRDISSRPTWTKVDV